MTVGRRERKKQATRAALREAALRLALEHGIENVTVEQIADAADVALRTFFNYFSSKEEAVVAADAARHELLLDEFRARPAAEGVLTALHAAALVFVDDLSSRERLEELRMMRRSPALLPHQLAAYAAAERALAVAVAERIGEPGPEPEPRVDGEGPDEDAVPERPVGLYPCLVAATTLAGVRIAMQRWTDQPAGGTRERAALNATLGEVFDRLGRGLEAPRPADLAP